MYPKCDVCEKIFSTNCNLNKHLKNVHKIQKKYGRDVYTSKCIEDECNNSFIKVDDLISHLVQQHDKRFEIVETEFACFEDFKNWKSEIEKSEKSSYIVGFSASDENRKRINYHCHRGGKFASNSIGKRLPRTQGSCKLNYNCTSMIKMVEDKKTNKCLVKWIKTHYGHSIELQHLRLSKDVRSDVYSRLIAGSSFRSILNKYRKNTEGELQREYILTKKDIHNIKNSYKIKTNDSSCRENERIQNQQLTSDDYLALEESNIQTSILNGSRKKENIMTLLSTMSEDIANFENIDEVDENYVRQVTLNLQNSMNMIKSMIKPVINFEILDELKNNKSPIKIFDEEAFFNIQEESENGPNLEQLTGEEIEKYDIILSEQVPYISQVIIH